MCAIAPVGVVSVGLFVYIEVAVVAGIVAYAGNVGPVAIVAAYVVVNQHTLEVGCTAQPVLVKIVDEVAGHYLAAPVAHKAGVLQLIHIGVYECIACSGIFPRVEALVVIGVFYDFALDAAGEEQLCLMLVHVEAEEIAPQQFEDEPVGRFILCPGCFVSFYFGIDVPW